MSEKNRGGPRYWRRRTVVLVLLGMLATSTALRRWVINFNEVRSPSMQPCLEGDEHEGGDIVLVDILSYRLRDPRRGEVVAFWEDGDTVMKRVAGLPREAVRITGAGKVLVNGKAHRVEAIDRICYEPYGNVRRGRPYHIPAQGYFVLGDHTRDSYDSRFHGAIKRKAIHGRALFIVWPPSRFGRVR